jgi:hypothetical protein
MAFDNDGTWLSHPTKLGLGFVMSLSFFFS